LQGLDSEEVRKLLLGDKGSQAMVQAILANGQDHSVKVKRTELEQLRIHSFMLANQVLYVHVPAFYAQLPSDLAAAINSKRQTLGQPITGLVLDLRGNGGGLLSAAGDTLGMFLPLGSVYAIQRLRKQGSDNVQQLTTLQAPSYGGLPLAVIVDQTSASAAEVFAMALQERNRALVLGQPTRGKTSIQKVFNLGNAQSYTLTVGEYVSAKGITINKVGLKPQMLLEFAARPPHNSTLPEVYRFAAAQDPWVVQAHQQLVNPLNK
jgi:carboxyl-terminal processing protease